MKKHLIAVFVVLLIEAITYFIEIKTGSSKEAFESVVGVATLVGLFAVIMLSAEDSFGNVCSLAIGPIVTVVVTGFTIIFATGVNPGALMVSALCVGVVIVFGLAWIGIDEYLEKKKAIVNY